MGDKLSASCCHGKHSKGYIHGEYEVSITHPDGFRFRMTKQHKEEPGGLRGRKFGRPGREWKE